MKQFLTTRYLIKYFHVLGVTIQQPLSGLSKMRRMCFFLAGILFVGCSILGGNSQHITHAVNASDGQLSFAFVGDTRFGGHYQEDSKNFITFLRQADLVIANLETPITNLPSSPFVGKKSYIHRSGLSKTPKALKEHNISVVSLANNHTLDYGMKGLQQSLHALKKHDIQWVGAGMNERAAIQPLRFDYQMGRRNFQFVIAAGFEYRKKYSEVYNFYAYNDKGGTNAWTVNRARKQMKAIRHANPKAFIVAYPHFGKNYAWKTKKQTKLAQALIDAGANLVIGHGAHMLQEIEQYRGRWIIYSLGNFVFNSPGQYKKKKMDPFSLVARMDVVEKKEAMILSLRLYPIFTDNLITDYQPYFVTDQQFNRAQDLIMYHNSNKESFINQMGTGKDKFGRYLVFDVTPNKRMQNEDYKIK